MRAGWVERAVRELRRYRTDSIELVLGPAEHPAPSATGALKVRDREAWIIDLGGGVQRWRDCQVNKRVRRQLRICEDEGVSTTRHGIDGLDALYDLYERAVRQNTNRAHYRKEFLADLMTALSPGEAIIYLTHHQDRTIAGGILLRGDRDALAWIGCFDKAIAHLHGNLHRHYTVIRDLEADGVVGYNLGAAPNLPEVTRFKQKARCDAAALSHRDLAQSNAVPHAPAVAASVVIERYRLALSLAAEPHFNVPVVVMQSDEWGHACVDNPEQHERVLRAGVDGSGAWFGDALESDADVTNLAASLREFRDVTGRSARLTLNFIVARPDYDAIEATDFRAYRSIPIRPAAALLDALRAPDPEAVFEVQLHGAEHIAPARWLRLLQEGAPDVRAYFAVRAMPPPGVVARHPGLGAAYLPCPDDRGGAAVPSPDERVLQSLRVFASLFSRQAQGFVPPNHAWDGSLDRVLRREGVRHLQACHVRYPTFAAAESGQGHALRAGPERGNDLWRQTRNVHFEPVVWPDLVDAAIARACLLVARGIPAVINTHRINYAGAIRPERVAHGRERLGDLLSALVATRDDVHFLGSDEFDAVLRSAHPAIRRRPIAGRRSLLTDVAWATLGRQPVARH